MMLNHLFVVVTLVLHPSLNGPAILFVSLLKYSVTRLLCTAGTYLQNGKLQISDGTNMKTPGFFVDDDVNYVD